MQGGTERQSVWCPDDAADLRDADTNVDGVVPAVPDDPAMRRERVAIAIAPGDGP